MKRTSLTRKAMCSALLLPAIMAGALPSSSASCVVTLTSYDDGAGTTNWSVANTGTQSDTYSFATSCALAITCTGVSPASGTIAAGDNLAGIDGTYTRQNYDMKGVMELTAVGTYSSCSSSRSIFPLP